MVGVTPRQGDKAMPRQQVRTVPLTAMIRHARASWAGATGEYPNDKYVLKVLVEVSAREAQVWIQILEPIPDMKPGQKLDFWRAVKEDVMRQLGLKVARVFIEDEDKKKKV